MSVIFAGGELSSFVSFNAIETTSIANSYAAPARCGIHIMKGGFIRTDTLAGASEVWIHADLHMEEIVAGNNVITLLDSTGATIFLLDSTGGVYVGGVKIGTTALITQGTFTVDVHVRGGTGSTGLVEIYANSQIMFSAVGAFAIAANSLVLGFTGSDTTANTNTVWSQVIVANEITIGFKLATLSLSATGGQTQWVGAPSDINEIALDTTTYISANVSNLYETFITGGLDPSYTNIRAVVISAIGRYSASGPKNLDGVTRIAATNYTSSMTALGTGFTPSQTIITNDPSTLIAWTNAGVNAAEFGIRSKS